MKLSTWATQQGLTYKTAWRLWHDGRLPIPAEQLATGTILVHPAPRVVPNGAVLYARVSGSDQKADLERQVGRLVTYAAEQQLTVTGVVAEVGSGLNGHRPKLLKLLADGHAQVVVVEHRDRLARFGAEYIEAALAASGRRVVVIDQTEMQDDLVQDMIEVMTSFCARLYGRRAARRRAEKGVAAAMAARES
jgi:putative resolvase